MMNRNQDQIDAGCYWPAGDAATISRKMQMYIEMRGVASGKAMTKQAMPDMDLTVHCPWLYWHQHHTPTVTWKQLPESLSLCPYSSDK